MERAAGPIRARAWFLGTRLDLKGRAQSETGFPVMEPYGNGDVALFRFGVAVGFKLDDAVERELLTFLSSLIESRHERPESETYTIRVDPSQPEQVDAQGQITLRDMSTERLLVVAHALAKSVVLAHYETQVSPMLERVEQVAMSLQAGLSGARRAELLQGIGSALLIESRTVGRIEVAEKPDITWENTELDRLYERLALDLELHARDNALSRKLTLVSRTSELYLDLLHSRQGIRVEWYIVILILVDIVINVVGSLAANGA